jgi:PAS domain S-box-containing protein
MPKKNIDKNIDICPATKDETDYKAIFLNMIDGCALHEIIVDSKGVPIDYKFIDINPAFEKMTGLKRQDVVDRLVTEVIPGTKEDPANWISKYGEVALNGKRIEFENYSAALKKWFKVSAYSPKKNFFITIFDDITNSEADHKLLLSKTALLEAQMNSTIDGIIAISENNKRLLINKRMIELFNIPKNILVDEDDSKLLNHVSSLVKHQDKFIEKIMYLNSHPDDVGHDEIEFKNGMVLDRYSAPILDNSGTRYGRIWIFRDMTERKKIETLLVKEKKEQDIILDSILAGVFYKDDKNHFIRVNKAFADTLEIPKNILEGKSLAEIFPKEQAESFFNDDKEVIKSGKPKLNIIEEVKTSKGVLFVRTDKIPYLDDNGKVIGIIGFTIDITAEKKSEEANKEHNEELEKINRLMVDREVRMVELKKTISELEAKLKASSNKN